MHDLKSIHLVAIPNCGHHCEGEKEGVVLIPPDANLFKLISEFRTVVTIQWEWCISVVLQTRYCVRYMPDIESNIVPDIVTMILHLVLLWVQR